MSFNVIQALNNLSASLAGLTTAPNTIAAIDEITAAITALGGITGPIADNTYLPVASNLTNCTCVPTIAMYMQIGKSVMVAGGLTLTGTAPGVIAAQVNVPVATVFAALTDGAGSYIVQEAQFAADVLISVVGTDRMLFSATSVAGGPIGLTYTYMYRILP